MSNRVFIVVITILVIGFGGIVVNRRNSEPKEAIIGVQHKDQGENHIAEGQKHDPYNSEPASSGPHYAGASAPTQWGIYAQELPAEIFLHNEEHGGVVVAYKPGLPTDQLKKLQALFAPPYSDKKFSPSKAIVMPRAKNTKAIELASWKYTLSMDQYDEATIKKFYLQRVGKSPEPGAGPSNTPINQAIN